MTSNKEEGFTSMNEIDRLLDYYQFSHDPFAPRTPGFKFFTPKRKPVLAELHHLARYSSQMLVVTGPEGSGKTLLRQALVASSNKESVQCVVLSAREFSAEDALLGYVCQAVNADGRDVGSLLDKSQSSDAVGIQLYLVIDDAEALEPSALSMLTEIAEAGQTAPRVFLFADAELIAPALESLQASPEDSAFHLAALQPLDLDETRDYLGQRLEGAGQGIELLSDEQIAAVHDQSGGWPGAINEAGRRIMLESMEQAPLAAAERAKRGGLPIGTLAALALVALGVGVAWYMGDQPKEPETTVLALPEPIPEVRLNGDAELESPVPPTAPLPAGSDMATGISPSPVAETDDADVPEVVEAAPAPEPESPPPVVAATSAAESAASSPPVAPVAAPALPAPASPAATAVAASNDSPKASSVVQGSTGTRQTSWYREQAASRYAIQLLGTRAEQSAVSFVEAHAQLNDIGYFETTHQGAPWFVVTQGSYGGRQAAQDGIAGLPQALRNSKPWPRSFGDIQKSLR
ncbi:MAG: AAA family ATPase [Pseudomonas neustonica]